MNDTNAEPSFKMTAERLLDAVGEVAEEMIAEAHGEFVCHSRGRGKAPRVPAPGADVDEAVDAPVREKPARRGRRWIVLAAAAACLCLALFGLFRVLDRLDYLGAQCGSYPGTVVDGVYYYKVPHKGIYRYRPDGVSERVLSEFRYEFWNVNEYGLYYTEGRSLYVLPHGTGRAKKLYTANLPVNHVNFSFTEEGDVLLVGYLRGKGARARLLLDGQSGEVRVELPAEVPDGSPYRVSDDYTIGTRRITVTRIPDRGYDLLENGVSILPPGVTVNYPGHYGGMLIAPLPDGGDAPPRFFIVRAEGDTLLTVTSPEGLTPGGILGHSTDGRFLFSTDGDRILCLSTDTGELRALPTDTPYGRNGFCDLSTDGAYLYTCEPWRDGQTCWEIVYEDGSPARLRLVDADIVPH